MEKKFIFIDNDNIGIAKEDVENNVLPWLDNVMNITIDDIDIIPDFYRLDRDEMFQILFDTDKPKFFYSMFTATHCNSFGMAKKLITAAGRNSIKDKTIVFFGHQLFMKFLERVINDDNIPGIVDFIAGVARNTIIGQDGSKFYTYKFDFSQERNNFVVIDSEIDLSILRI